MPGTSRCLKTQCHDVLVASFPSRKQWKALSKRRRRRRRKEEKREEAEILVNLIGGKGGGVGSS